jgi:protein-disulfide isomerase
MGRGVFFAPIGLALAGPVLLAQASSNQSSAVLAVYAAGTISLRDLDPAAIASAEKLDAALAAARRQALDDAIDDALLDLDAKKAGTTADRLYVREVFRRVTDPGEAEIAAEHASTEDLREAPIAEVRDLIVGTLRDRREARLLEERSAQSRRRHRVESVADAGRSDLRGDTVLALVDERPVTWASIAQSAAAREDDARWTAYRTQRASLERVIRQRLLVEEAGRRGLTKDELLRVEVADKVKHPTDEQVAAFYAENRADFRGDLAASRADIVGFLEQEARSEAEQALARRLAAAAGVKVNLAAPGEVVLSVPSQGPSRGSPSAPVTLVEFGDFECGPCGRMKPAVDEILATSGDRVRFVFRHLPLSIHPHARRAAEAAACADSKGKFWPYYELLYAHQNALSDSELRGYAEKSGLSSARFRADLAGEACAAVVVRDLRDSRRLVARGTPTFFVNGVRVRQYGAEGLRAAIDSALAASGAARPR